MEAAVQGTIEVIWALSDILASSGNEFELEDVRIIDPRQKSIELRFLIDFGGADVATHAAKGHLRVG